MIRKSNKLDIEQIKEVYEKFYKDKFDWFGPLLESYTITNKKDELVLFGGIKLIPEVVLLTDKDKSSRDKYEALYEFLELISYTAKRYNFNEIHIFPENDKIWRDRLVKDGFRQTIYPAFVKEV